MHELSIVQNILEIANNEVKKVNAHKVDQIDLQIGYLAGVEMDALLFAWNACVPETVLANAERIIHLVPAKAKCTNCKAEFETEDYFAQCPDCNEYLTELIQGKELKIKQLVVS
ncbi:MAG: hydrogenase maturation nickel metallochaperone HypA [Bacteroidia bacterium]|nr:hydrogenase maturation nickel metallochaperone HypA [Bacteroidia bacterium]